jgi:predicted ATP-binding protein involved in virulence
LFNHKLNSANARRSHGSRKPAPHVLPSGKTTDITALSSGERQIFVLITHLVFTPLMRAENVLLIDEPELSLHLKWQKGFVSAIRAANPGIQMILATHSPEIIFDLEDKMIPLEF